MYRGNGSSGEAGRSGGRGGGEAGKAATDTRVVNLPLGTLNLLDTPYVTCTLLHTAYQMTEASNPHPTTGNIKFPLARQI